MESRLGSHAIDTMQIVFDVQKIERFFKNFLLCVDDVPLIDGCF